MELKGKHAERFLYTLSCTLGQIQSDGWLPMPGRQATVPILHQSCGLVQVWILAAQFEIRQLSMDAARKILGRSLGMCPKDRTYRAYIDVSCASAL